MARALQLVGIPLKNPTFTASGNDSITLDGLPETYLGRIAHLAGLQFDCTITPTFTTAPTVVGINNIVSRLEFNDGAQARFQGGFNAMRMFEILEGGKLAIPDPDTDSASTNPFYLGRYLPMGPWGFEGNPSDFLIPCAALKTGRLDFAFPAITAFSADTTVLTVAIRLTAWLALLDNELRVPPFLERNSYQVANADASLPGRALYCAAGLLNSASFDAITAGDFSAIQLGTGAGDTAALDCSVLERAFHHQMNSGHLTQAHGEPRAATDDNPKKVNGGTPTAIAAADALIQPIIWSPNGSRISKLAIAAESSLRVRWPAGSQATGVILASRILAQPVGAASAITARALSKLGMMQKGTKVKTLSKQPYTGPRSEFMPWDVSVG